MVMHQDIAAMTGFRSTSHSDASGLLAGQPPVRPVRRRLTNAMDRCSCYDRHRNPLGPDSV